MKAIILGAGCGSRLSKLTKNMPKNLLDINGKNILGLNNTHEMNGNKFETQEG